MDKYKSSAIAMILSPIFIGLIGFLALFKLIAIYNKSLIFLVISITAYCILLFLIWKIFSGINKLGKDYNSKIIRISAKWIFVLQSLIIVLLISLDGYLHFFNYNSFATSFFNLLVYSIIQGSQIYILKIYVITLSILFFLAYSANIFLGIGLIKLKEVEDSSFSGWLISLGSVGAVIKSILISTITISLLGSKIDYNTLGLLFLSGLSIILTSFISLLSLAYIIGYIILIIILFNQSKKLGNKTSYD